MATTRKVRINNHRSNANAMSNQLSLFVLLIARKDIDDLLAAISKMENSNKMASALADSSISDNSIELILKAINDMQDKIKADFDEKLTNYVQMPDFTDSQNELKTVSRRVGYNEGVLNDLKDTTGANSERIETNRKKLARL